VSAPVPSVWIVPPHADKTLPAVLCPEQQDCIDIANGAIAALRHFISDVERGNTVAAEHSRATACQIVHALGPAWLAMHEAATGPADYCRDCGNLADVDCRCDEEDYR
jgi:hypothetical protein